MNSQDYRNLQEAYLNVYEQKESLDEGIGSAIRGFFGKKQKPEAPEPLSRGAQLRQKYGTETSPKRQILDRTRERAEKDEKEYGDSPYSKSVATKSREAHKKYLDAGISKYDVDDGSGGEGGSGKRGGGNAARRRAEKLNKEQVEYWVNSLLKEGYDLSEYTWEDMYEIYLEESSKRIDPKIPGGKDNVKYMNSRSGAGKMISGDSDVSGAGYMRRGGGVQTQTNPNMPPVNQGRMDRDTRTDLKYRKEYRKAKGGSSSISFLNKSQSNDVGGQVPSQGFGLQGIKLANSYEPDLFDVILEYLLDEGYADTNENALVIMANMSEDWKYNILEAIVYA